MEPVSVGMRIRQLRLVTGKTGQEFADGISWSRSKMSRIETGARRPSKDDLVEIVEAAVPEEERADVLQELLDLPFYPMARPVPRGANAAALAARSNGAIVHTIIDEHATMQPYALIGVVIEPAALSRLLDHARVTNQSVSDALSRLLDSQDTTS